MIIHEIHDLSNEYVTSLLKTGLSEIVDDTYKKNYHYDNIDVPGNLFNTLVQGRYINGKYFVIEEDGIYVASSGYNYYENDTALVLPRK